MSRSLGRVVCASVALMLLCVWAAPIAQAKGKDKDKAGRGQEKAGDRIERELDEEADRVRDEVTDHVFGEDASGDHGDRPPGLEKKGKVPPGLAKQGKRPPGWDEGGKEGWEKGREDGSQDEGWVRRTWRRMFGGERPSDGK